MGVVLAGQPAKPGMESTESCRRRNRDPLLREASLAEQGGAGVAAEILRKRVLAPKVAMTGGRGGCSPGFVPRYIPGKLGFSPCLRFLSSASCLQQKANLVPESRSGPALSYGYLGAASMSTLHSGKPVPEPVPRVEGRKEILTHSEVSHISFLLS